VAFSSTAATALWFNYFDHRCKLSLTPTARRRPRPEELGTLVQVVLYFRAATFKDSEGNDIQLYEPPRN
jgi:hypothetical protein